MSMQKVLIADDEPRIRHLVCDFLKKSGYDTVEAEDGAQALEQFEKNPDTALIILDVMMPEVNGWDVCKKIREQSDVPILMLTARSQEFDELMGFEAGADDYVVKPFSPSVLVKRVEALLRRGGAITETAQDSVHMDGLAVNDDAHVVTLNGEHVELTLKEYDILHKLLSSIGRVYSREQLLDSIWGYDYVGDIRTVDSHVARLRTKLGEWGNRHLKTVYGIGYKIEVAER
ncbi:MAG TPA: response regulator transcription factor [Candidatus Onthovicinus excrementipullorum]|nr:response regulator transcription factor [Candidatus Onthovicinus excrementipullorum]